MPFTATSRDRCSATRNSACGFHVSGYFSVPVGQMLFPAQTRLILPSRLHPKQMATCLPVPARNVDLPRPSPRRPTLPVRNSVITRLFACHNLLAPGLPMAGLPHVPSSGSESLYNLHCRGDPRARSSVKPISKGSPFLLGLRFALSLPFVCQKISYISALAQAVFVPSWIMRLSSRTRPLFQFHAEMQIPPHRPSPDERIVPNGRRSSL